MLWLPGHAADGARPTAADLKPTVSTEQLRRHVYMLAGDIGETATAPSLARGPRLDPIGERNIWRPQALRRAEEYIRSVWRGQGHAVAAQTYALGEESWANLEIVLPGTDLASQIVLVGAHYDSVQGSPGANDNATGVAALLELGRCLADRQHRRTIRLVAFANEEPPLFWTRAMGSDVYARAARARADDIRAMLSVETIGYYSEAPGSQRYPPILDRFYPDRANFIGFVSNLASRALLKRAVAAFRAASDFPVEALAAPAFVPGVGWSDQLSFWFAGYPGIMVTDTALYRYPWYHTPQDTPDKIDYARLTVVTQGLCATLATLADADEL
jgi:Zn-dependent M28 family amino/carboxypeptidase